MAPSADISLRPTHMPHWLGHSHPPDHGVLTMPNPLAAYHSAVTSAAAASSKSPGDYSGDGCRRMSLQSYASSQTPSPTGSPAMMMPVGSPPAAERGPMFRTTSTGYGFSVYGSLGDMVHHEERIAAALRRMVVHKDDLRHVPLFAWGRMTMTIKDARERTLELWKPKRHEIVAVVAAIYMRCHAGILTKSMPPGYGFIIEDGEGTGALQLQAQADDFVGLQVEIDTHWGVHKKACCPAVRPLSRMGLSPACKVSDTPAAPLAARSRKASEPACPRPESAAVAVPVGNQPPCDSAMLPASCPSRLEQGVPASWLNHQAVVGRQRTDDASVAMALLQLAGSKQPKWPAWPSPSPPVSPTLSLASDSSVVSPGTASAYEVHGGRNFHGPSAVLSRTSLSHTSSPPPIAGNVRHHPYANPHACSSNGTRTPFHVPWRPWATD